MPDDHQAGARKKRRTIIGTSIAAAILVIGIANACGSPTPPTDQPAGNISTATTQLTTPATAAPTTTTVAPVTTTTPPPPPPVTSVAAQAPVVAPPTEAAPPQEDTETDCGSDSYINSDGQCVHDPSSSPTGATAKCKDGTYSYSKHHSGTCSGHGGVAEWL